ncbi:unnamed protein product, partial [Mesorhabditis belari]|uniref:Pre-mRNA-splicing factor 38 n=1 Tax=Mesorhabditis belari TaxID=2138241 RepID=A0AAF3EL91_9BILA
MLCLISRTSRRQRDGATLQPDREIVMEFIKQDEFKYIRALGALYLRMVFPSLDTLDIYNYLEPLYSDFRKLRVMNHMGRFELMYMDDFIDMLLREESVFDIQMSRLRKRIALEEIAAIEEYKSPLDEDLRKVSESESDDDDKATRKKERPSLISRKRSRSRERGERDRDDRKKRFLFPCAKQFYFSGGPCLEASKSRDVW